jgi:hypothetical protein
MIDNLNRYVRPIYDEIAQQIQRFPQRLGARHAPRSLTSTVIALILTDVESESER